MIEKDRALEIVLGSDAMPNIKPAYEIDTEKYSWVNLYLRDKAARENIKKLESEIPPIANSLISKDELREAFVSLLNGAKEFMLSLITDYLSAVQKRKQSMRIEDIAKFNAIRPLNLSDADLDMIFSRLEIGVSKKVIDQTISDIQTQIWKIRTKIDTELSPRERWIHYESGLPMSYPDGCKWTKFVDDWKKVVSRFNGRVNINGFPLESPEEETAYMALELDKVYKREPLRNPRVKPPRPKIGKELYEDSVRITPLRS